jgi:tetratricopeptide (TPR) repeat protein
MARSDGPADAEPKTKIFISYSRKDTAFVNRVEEALKARNFHPLIDRSDIYVFEDWWQRIKNLIVEADTVVFVLSPDYVSSETCKKEIEFAASRNKRLAPIEYRPTDCKVIPEQIERLNFEFCLDLDQFEQNMDRLAAALRTDIDWIRKHTKVGAQAHDWRDEGRPRGLLLRSPVLEEAEHWITVRPRTAPMPTEETREFITVSRHVRLRQRDVAMSLLTVGLLFALGLAGFASWQRWDAEKAAAAAQAETARARLALDTTRQVANSLVLNLGRDPRLAGLPQDLTRQIFDGAVEGYSQVIKLDPSNAITYNDRGNAFFGRASLGGDPGDYDRAIADYSRALEFAPGYATAYSNRCWTRVIVAKDLQQAVSDCDAALRFHPQNIRALDNRGFAYLKLGRVADAIKSFNAALDIDPEFPTSIYGRSLAEMTSGDCEAAEADMVGAAAIEVNVAGDLARYGIGPVHPNKCDPVYTTASVPK